MNNLKMRSALLSDTSTIFSLIRELAKYEKLENMVTGNKEALKNNLFTDC